MADTVIYRVQCAAITRGCLSAIAIDGPRGIDLAELDGEVPEDRRVLDLLRSAGWRLDYGKWICGNHVAADSKCARTIGP